LNYDVGGTSPSFAITKCYLEPVNGLAPPAVDEQSETGAASQISAL
jgi:hypothetical protein